MPSFSFAIGPIEMVDTRETSEDWVNPVDTPPVEPTPRDLPMATGEIITPACILSAAILTGERRVGYIASHPTARTVQAGDTSDHASRYVTFLHADEPREIEIALHWGPHFFNGVELKPVDDPLRRNRQTAKITLNEGWNLLCGEPRQLRPMYPVLIGLPGNVTARATPDLDETAILRYQPPRRIGDGERWTARPPRNAEDVAGGDWVTTTADERPALPARMMSWDQVQPGGSTDLPATVESDHTFVFGFGTEFLGHLQIDIDAPAGTVVDVAYDERRRGDGALDLFATNPYVDAADRFVCRGGRQAIETFHPRGGQFVQITLRPAGGPATLHGVTLRDARCLTTYEGAFECDEPTLNWAWSHGTDTLRASTEDVFCDSPWRERGLYLGDSYVQAMAHLCCTSDHRIVRRALRLFSESELPDGQLACVTPGWLRLPHADFSLMYAIWLDDYWSRTGDFETVRRCLPTATRVLRAESFVASEHSVLWNASEANRLFIDWGVDRSIRTLDENAVLNGLRIEALARLATLHDVLGDGDQARRLREERATIVAAFQERLWMEEEGRFAAGTSEGEMVRTPCLHANVLAMAYLPDVDGRVIEYVMKRLVENAAHAAKGVAHDDFCELFFLHFALHGLVRFGRHDVAERVIADHMRVMMDHNASTMWECIHRGVNRNGSLCHAWSVSPMIYAQRYVLGVREATAGQPDTLVIDPRTTLDQASGVVPHPRGSIRVSWHRRGDQIEVEHDGPAGVTITRPPASAADGRGPS